MPEMVPEVVRKVTKMEQKRIQSRLRKMCEKYAIYLTGSTLDLFRNRLQRNFSSITSEETQRRGLKAYFSDFGVALGSLFGPVLCQGGLLKSVRFFDSFFGWRLTS